MILVCQDRVLTLLGKILGFRCQEFPNLSVLVELALCMSGSNSSVERSFSIMTLVLSDRRLGMLHDTIEKCMIVASNDTNWSKEEKEMLIHRAVDVYMQKRRITVFSSKNTSAENIATIDVQTSGELAQCSAMEENSSSNSELDIESEYSSSYSKESGG